MGSVRDRAAKPRATVKAYVPPDEAVDALTWILPAGSCMRIRLNPYPKTNAIRTASVPVPASFAISRWAFFIQLPGRFLVFAGALHLGLCFSGVCPTFPVFVYVFFSFLDFYMYIMPRWFVALFFPVGEGFRVSLSFERVAYFYVS